MALDSLAFAGQGIQCFREVDSGHVLGLHQHHDPLPFVSPVFRERARIIGVPETLERRDDEVLPAGMLQAELHGVSGGVQRLDRAFEFSGLRISLAFDHQVLESRHVHESRREFGRKKLFALLLEIDLVWHDTCRAASTGR